MLVFTKVLRGLLGALPNWMPTRAVPPKACKSRFVPNGKRGSPATACQASHPEIAEHYRLNLSRSAAHPGVPFVPASPQCVPPKMYGFDRFPWKPPSCKLRLEPEVL